jgi:hypothetical protein
MALIFTKSSTETGENLRTECDNPTAEEVADAAVLHR